MLCRCRQPLLPTHFKYHHRLVVSSTTTFNSFFPFKLQIAWFPHSQKISNSPLLSNTDLMADDLLASTVNLLVGKAIDLASEQLGLYVGFKKDLKKLEKTLTLIEAFLQDAEKEQATKEAVKIWLQWLEGVAFEADNLLDDFSYEMLQRKVEIRNQMKRKVRFFFSLSNPIVFRFKMANKIQKINMDLKSINEQAKDLGLQSHIGARDAHALYHPSGGGFMNDRETDSVTADASFVGRGDNLSAIVTQLTAMSNNETISVLPIVGMGGIGKTTLARKVFNDVRIGEHFGKERMWVCVSNDFNANRLFGLMLESLTGQEPKVESREARLKDLKESLAAKKFLLVLDNVWNEESTPWNEFLGALKGTSQAMGSWILVTTRKEQVANFMRISSSPCPLEPLSKDECWLILKEISFGAGEVPNGLQNIGLKIAQRCQGLPLVATVLGGMLRNKERDEWQNLEARLQALGGGGKIDDVIKILKLSFDRLPYPSLKKCFAYCSIFPKDFQMERNQLIQLWAAEGFLHSNPRNSMCMEEVGNMYFTILLDGNLFQYAKKDVYGNVLNCKMHDLVHDMVQSISKSKTLRLTESDSVEAETFAIRHLALESSGEKMPFPSTESFKYITTLFLLENISLNDREISFFMLRVLKLRSLNVKELPKSIGKLSHLKYLDSSNTPVETLPDSLCRLYNLQTLRVRDCKSLAKFPNNFKNLVNLRHFDFFSEDKSSDLMPLEIGQLHSLQTLPFFNVGEEMGRQIGELKSLENLSGGLEIRNLELVRSKEEAKSANLIEKPNICELRLLWNELDNQREDNNECSQVLESLRPNQNLKGLMIERFFGDQLSTWIGELEKLVKLELRNCKNCKELPTLGHMPFLKYLHLEGLDGVTRIGPFFYGGSAVHTSSSNPRPLELFPVLEHLILKDMVNLSEWMEATGHDGTVVVFPVLDTLSIENNPQIATVPSHFPHLKNLTLYKINNGSIIVGNICSRVRTLASLFIYEVNGLTELPHMLFQNNPSLADIMLFDCSDLTEFFIFLVDIPRSFFDFPQQLVGLVSLEELVFDMCSSLKSISIPMGHQYLSALRILRIESCSELTHLSIPQISESESDSTCSPSSVTCPLSPLEHLDVFSCDNLLSFPIDLTRAPSLSSLRINGDNLIDLPKGKLCSLTKLRQLDIGPFSKTAELHSFLDLFHDLQPHHPYLPSLFNLQLRGWPHWESLPEQLQHLSGLKYLSLIRFGVKSLPDWFGKLSSLEALSLDNCKMLGNLPSHHSMRSLTQLRSLWIGNCPLLKERCKPESSTDHNSEWSKISHIPHILIDWQQISC